WSSDVCSSDLLLEQAVGQAEVRGHPLRLRLGRITAGGVELGLQARVAVHRLLAPGLGEGHVPHLLLGAAELLEDPVEAAGGEDAREHALGVLAAVRVLREIAELAGDLDAALSGIESAGEDLGE